MRAAFAVVMVCACGDNARVDDVIEARSGARLALEMWAFDDGTRRPVGDAYYDTSLHARCVPTRWGDGELRCAPVADDAIFADADCTTPVGRKVAVERPTHFIGYDVVLGARVPMRVYAAGAPRAAISEYYERAGDTCDGPYPTATDREYYDLGAETTAAGLVGFRETELAGERLVATLRETDDGSRVVTSLADAAHGFACRLVPAGSTLACAPRDVAIARYFADSACGVPAAVVVEGMPTAIETRDDAGCGAYASVGTEVERVYERRGEACVVAPALRLERAFAVGAPIDVLALERRVDAGERRLSSIAVAHAGFAVATDLLHDAAMRADCRPGALGEGTRCLPVELASATTLYDARCVLPTAVAEVPARTCERAAFAIGPSMADPAEPAIRAIGERPAQTLYLRDGTCRVYMPPDGRELRLLGPELPAGTFVGALAFGDR